MPPVEFLVDRRDAGKTIAAVLRTRFNLPWSQVKRVIERGHVRVAGFACPDPGHRVKAKNRVWIREGVLELGAGSGERGAGGSERRAEKPAPPKPKPPAAKPASPVPRPEPRVPSSDFRVPSSALVYADDAVAVVNKPAGLTTSRSADEADEFGRGKRFLPKTLADLVPGLIGNPTARVTPVHRLDRDTTGLVVFALTPAAADDLLGQFRRHAVDRRYVALTRGVPTPGRIESVLVRDRGDGRRGSATGPDAEGGKRAVTHVAVLDRFGDFALVECRLETGRTHQVRIHLGEAGHPLCGESVYDRRRDGSKVPDGSGASRPMLHAARLGFAHPETGEPVRWEVSAPADFAAVLGRLRGAGS